MERDRKGGIIGVIITILILIILVVFSNTNSEKISIIENIARVVEVGQIYYGTVTRTTSFGAFVDIGGGKEGLVHISKIAKEHIKNVADYVNVGDKVPVKVIEIDDQGRINLTMKDLVENNSEENNNENSSEENTEALSSEEKIEE